MEAQCLMVNCRNKAPDDEAFCSKHRDTRDRKLEDISHAELLVRLATANEVIAEQLEIRKRLEAALRARVDNQPCDEFCLLPGERCEICGAHRP